VLDDRRGDNVALGVGQGLLFSADLERERKAHIVAQFLSDGRCPAGHTALENEARTKVNRQKRFLGREPNRPLGVLESVGGISILIWCRPDHGKRTKVPCTQGAAMTRILNDFLLFACATLFVTGIVLAAATLLI